MTIPDRQPREPEEPRLAFEDDPDSYPGMYEDEPMTTDIAERQETGVTNMMERLATSPEVDVAKLEKLLEMQKEIRAHEAEEAFNAAFADMQAEMPIITEKGEIKVGTEVRSRYAKFEDINEEVKPILQRHGFGVSFRIDISETNEALVTGILMHRAGHREQTSMRLPADTSGTKNAVQALGSSVSYGKRYVLCALLNITTRGEDNDGGGPTISEDQQTAIEDKIKEVGANRANFLKHIKVKSLDQVLVKDYAKVLAALEAKKKRSQ